MGYLFALEKDFTKRICREIYVNNKTNQQDLMNALIGTELTDEHVFLVVDALSSEGYLEFDNNEFIKVGNAIEELRKNGIL